MKKLTFFLVVVVLTGCRGRKAEVQKYLDNYNDMYAKLYYESSKAAWKTNTDIKEGGSPTHSPATTIPLAKSRKVTTFRALK